jgi:tetratricopeptide (TPR) repeat protein
MRRARTPIAILLIAATMFVVGTLAPTNSDEANGARPQDSLTPASATLLTAGSGDVKGLKRWVESGEASATDKAALALTYVQRSRDESDPSLLPTALGLLQEALNTQEDNYAALLGMASLSNASHDFSGSVRWARRAIEVNPYDEAPYGILGDALFELGRYDESDAAYQKMIDLRPNVASYVRASYAAQHHRRYRAALHAMSLAIDAGPRFGEEAAWLRHQRGDIYMALGRVERARRENKFGTKLAPGYAPPTVGVAESLIAEGRLAEALPIVERAANDLPSLEYLIKAGDLHATLGDEDEARAFYDRAEERLAAYRAAGVLPDIDFLLFYADHGVRLDDALVESRAVFRDRPTSGAADALAWVLHARGRDRTALRFSRRALATAPAPDALAHFHAGSIALELGKEKTGRRHLVRTLEIDPAFSPVQAPAARRILRSI